MEFPSVEATADLLLTQLPALQPVSPRYKAICWKLELWILAKQYDARDKVLFNSGCCVKDRLLYHAALADFKFNNLLRVKNQQHC